MHSTRRAASHRWQQQRNQDADDGDHHEKLDERKTGRPETGAADATRLPATSLIHGFASCVKGIRPGQGGTEVRATPSRDDFHRDLPAPFAVRRMQVERTGRLSSYSRQL